MSLAKWTVGLLAGMSMLALAAPADAGEVRVTVAEYSAKALLSAGCLGDIVHIGPEQIRDLEIAFKL